MNTSAVHTGGGRELEPQPAVIDRSSSGMLVLEGDESKEFLQRISTNNVSSVRPGACVQTVLTDEKGRVIDVVTAVIRSGSVLLITSEGRQSVVQAWLRKYIIMEDITVRDETGRWSCAVIIGWNEEPSPEESSTLTLHTFTLFPAPAMLVLAASRDELLTFLAARSLRPMTDDEWHEYRIARGIPQMGTEITEKTNPLEAGLRSLVDFTKGCYIGQEVIARLSTYGKVQRVLCRVRLSALPPDENSMEMIGENAILGYITALGRKADSDGSVRALAMLRTASAVVGATCTLSGTDLTATVEQIFL